MPKVHNQVLFSCVGSVSRNFEVSKTAEESHSSTICAIDSMSCTVNNDNKPLAASPNDLHRTPSLNSSGNETFSSNPDTYTHPPCLNSGHLVNLDSCVDTSLNDSELIPDTPESFKSVNDRKHFQRSFLMSSSNVIRNRNFADKKLPRNCKSVKVLSLERRLKQANCVLNADASLHASVDICDNDDDKRDFEIANAVVDSACSDGKRSLRGILSRPKRADNKLTPVKSEVLVRDASLGSSVSQKLFDQRQSCVQNDVHPSFILQSYKTSKKIDALPVPLELDLESDGALLDVLNELKVDSQKNDSVMELTAEACTPETAVESLALKSCEVACDEKHYLGAEGQYLVDTCLYVDSKSVEQNEAVQSDYVKHRISTDVYGHDENLDLVLHELRQSASPSLLHTELKTTGESIDPHEGEQWLGVTDLDLNNAKTSATTSYESAEKPGNVTLLEPSVKTSEAVIDHTISNDHFPVICRTKDFLDKADACKG